MIRPINPFMGTSQILVSDIPVLDIHIDEYRKYRSIQFTPDTGEVAGHWQWRNTVFVDSQEPSRETVTCHFDECYLWSQSFLDYRICDQRTALFESYWVGTLSHSSCNMAVVMSVKCDGSGLQRWTIFKCWEADAHVSLAVISVINMWHSGRIIFN